MIWSVYINFHEFSCCYEAKNDEKLKKLIQTVVFKASEYNFVQN
jgi:hypothetical protein